MPPRSRKKAPTTSDAIESLTRKQMLSIITAFNNEPSTNTATSTRPIKKRRLNVIHDDEEDEEESPQQQDEEGINSNQNQFFEGGFMIDDNEYNQGGGFDIGDTGGGFIMEEDAQMAGGFEREPDSFGGGGFIQENQMEEEQQPIPINSLSSPLSAAPPRSRIPFKSIPAALESINCSSNAQVMSLFREVASDDENEISSVSKDRFIQICAVLIGNDSDDEEENGKGGRNSDDDDEEDGKGEDSSDGEEEEYVEEDVRAKKGRSTTTRRLTRSNAPIESTQVEELQSEDDSAEESDVEISVKSIPNSSSKKGKGSTSSRKKSNRVVSTAEALDTFELFFEGSHQVGGNVSKRTIGFEEIQNAARILDETLTEDDIMAMLDLGNGNVVDLDAFSKILSEAM